jgi:hypothetical protein
VLGKKIAKSSLFACAVSSCFITRINSSVGLIVSFGSFWAISKSSVDFK